MNQPTPRDTFIQLLRNNRPQAIAWISGNEKNPRLSGLVKFYQTPYGGVLIEAEIFGLPNKSKQFSSDYYAMHIHEYGDCSLPFDKTGEHYNPMNQPHPMHAGDFPPLLGNQGYAWSSFYDKRFSITEIIGRSVIIHKHDDDFVTQPSGNSGMKIGCGVIHGIE